MLNQQLDPRGDKLARLARELRLAVQRGDIAAIDVLLRQYDQDAPSQPTEPQRAEPTPR